MQHLTIEDLARMVDESPSSEESAHLANCPECALELELLRQQTVALASLPRLEAPSTLWHRIEGRLRAEGRAAPARSRPATRAPLVRAAVNVGIFLLGAAAGASYATRDGAVSVRPPVPVDPEPPAAGSAAPAAIGPFTVSIEQAEQRLAEAEAEYTAALARYGALAGAPTEIDAVARLVALDGIVQTTGAALEAAPADPVINGYFLSAVGQREAVLQQIARSTDDGWF